MSRIEQFPGNILGHVLCMSPSKLLSIRRKPVSPSTITIKLNGDVYQRVVEAAASSQQSVVEWIQDMCHTATID